MICVVFQSVLVNSFRFIASKNGSIRLLQIPIVHKEDEHDGKDYDERKRSQEDEKVPVFPFPLFEGNYELKFTSLHRNNLDYPKLTIVC
jgi:hypothetical protein